MVYTHCRIVCDIAEQLYARSGVDADLGLVRAGALLHDVGVYRLYDAAGRLDQPATSGTGCSATSCCARKGCPRRSAGSPRTTRGSASPAQDVLRQELPLPPADYVAETPEEALVMYADKFHTKTAPPAFLTAAAYAAYVRRFGADKVAAFAGMRATFGDPDARAA